MKQQQMKDTVDKDGANSALHLIEDESDIDDTAYSNDDSTGSSVGTISPVHATARPLFLVHKARCERGLGFNTIQCAIDAIDESSARTRRFANHVISAESTRVERERELLTTKRRRLNAADEERLDEKHKLLKDQDERRMRMDELLFRLEDIQSELLDELFACADDEDLRNGA